MQSDVQQFSRKLRLPEVFYTEIESEEDKFSNDSIIKNKSALNPPRNRDKMLDQKILLIVWTFLNCKKAPENNLPNGQL